MTAAVVTRRERLLQHPAFVRVWGGQAAGAITDQLIPVALSVYAVSRGGAITDVGLVLGGRAFALVVCLLIGGHLADRFSRTRLLRAADWMRSVVLLAAALTLPVLPLWSLALVTAVLGAGEAISRPAFRALVPSLLPGMLWQKANAHVAMTQRGAAVVGALVGVLLVTWLGAPGTLIACAALLTFAGALVGGIDDRRQRSSTATTAVGAYREALGTIGARPWAVAVMGMTCVHLLAGSALALATLPVVSEERFGSSGPYAAALAAMAAGALPGAWLTSRWQTRRPGLVGVGSLLLFTLVPLGVAFAPEPWLVVVAFALGGFSIEVFFVHWISAIQRTFSGDLLGKVFALDQLAAYAMLPVGLLLAGPLAATFGVVPTLSAGAGLVLASTVLCLLVPGVVRLGGAEHD